MTEMKDKRNEFIHAASSCPPDYATMQRMINEGFDINDYDKESSYPTSILSDILLECGCFSLPDECSDCENYLQMYGDHYGMMNSDGFFDYCLDCPIRKENAFNPEQVPQVVQFMLDHGFDLTARDGLVGADCLSSAHVLDENLLDVLKLLIINGADPTCIYEDENAIDHFYGESSAESMLFGNFKRESLFATAGQMLEAYVEGKDYMSVFSYAKAIDKSIKEIILSNDKTSVIIYCDNACLCITDDMYVSVNPNIFTDSTDMTNVSNSFKQFIGQTISQFYFEHWCENEDIVEAIRIETTAGNLMIKNRFPPLSGGRTYFAKTPEIIIA